MMPAPADTLDWLLFGWPLSSDDNAAMLNTALMPPVGLVMCAEICISKIHTQTKALSHTQTLVKGGIAANDKGQTDECACKKTTSDMWHQKSSLLQLLHPHIYTYK